VAARAENSHREVAGEAERARVEDLHEMHAESRRHREILRHAEQSGPPPNPPLRAEAGEAVDRQEVG
jgi:hypothetical protein